MAIGFNVNNSNDNKQKSREQKDDELIDNLRKSTGREQTSGRQRVSRGTPPSQEEESLYESGEVDSKKKVLVPVLCVIGICAIALVAFSVFSSDGSDEDQAPQQEVQQDVSSNTDQGTTIEETTPPSEYANGDTDYSNSNKNTAPNKVFSDSDFVKDLDGNDVKAVYNVASKSYIKAHVSYTLHRALVDDGMEMYWIDVVYKKKKYRCQVPFYYAKDMDDTGVCRVEIEILYLEGGGEIISYMQVIDEEQEGDTE